MSWSLTAQGHTLTASDEADLIDALRGLCQVKEIGVSYATIGTQYHGQVDLLTNVDGAPWRRTPKPDAE